MSLVTFSLPHNVAKRNDPSLAMVPLLRRNGVIRRLELYPFRFRDPLSGKWIRARHKLQVPELQRRYAEREIIGTPEIRHVAWDSVEPLNPFRPPAPARVCIAPMLLKCADPKKTRHC